MQVRMSLKNLKNEKNKTGNGSYLVLERENDIG